MTVMGSFLTPIVASGDESSQVDLTTELVWSGVPEGVTVPSVKLQLVREDNGVYNNVGVPVTLAVGTKQHVFSVEPGDPAYTYDVRIANYSTFQNDYTYQTVPVGQGFKITLTYEVKTKIDIPVKLVWTGKPFDTHGFVKPGNTSVQLYRNGTGSTSKIVYPVDMIETATGWEAEFSFTNLNRFVPNTNNTEEYTYTIDSGTEPRYSKAVNGFTIDFDLIPQTRTITIKKIWKGGPEQKPDAIMNLDLVMDIITQKTETVIFDNPSQVAPVNGIDTWEETKTVTMSTELYANVAFTLSEQAVANYRSVKAGNWVNGFTVTNIYQSDVTATKEWIGGPELGLPVKFKLMRQAGTGPKLQVQYLKTLSPGVTQLVWTGKGTEVTNDAGIPYTYWVEETTVLENYEKHEDGLAVTNTYVSPKIDVTGTKVWVDGPQVKPAFAFRLWRHIEDGLPMLVAGMPIAPGTAEIIEYTWDDLDETDSDANPYIYTINEFEVPANYVKTLDGLTVTNTYVSPKTKITGTKIWVDGPDVNPTIELQLYRDGQPLSDFVKTLENGTETAIWDDLDETDQYGVPYVYTVDEVTTPENYIKTRSEDKLTVTNAFINNPSLVITKQIENLTLGEPAEDETIAKIGETVRYTVVVTNDGNVKLTDVYLTDDEAMVGSSVELNGTEANWISGPDGIAMVNLDDMAPGEMITIIYDYDVVKEDEARGPFINTAAVYGTMNETSDYPDGKKIQTSAGATLTVEIITAGEIVVPAPGEKNNTMFGLGLVLIGSAAALTILRRRDRKVKAE